MHFELLKLQLQRRVGEGRVPTMWTSLAPRDQSGQAFTCFVRFEYGPATAINFDLDGPLDLGADDWESRLESAIFDAECGGRSIGPRTLIGQRQRQKGALERHSRRRAGGLNRQVGSPGPR